jgi:hypothetical protein
LIENVPGLPSRFPNHFRRVVLSFAEMGYQVGTLALLY